MRKYFTSESVSDGHPDKICDQIADGILDELLRQDPCSRSACEVTAESGSVHIMGEITTKADVDYIKTARKIIREAGYTKAEYGFDDNALITCSLHEQSPDIAMGVDSSFADESTTGAGDQGMMFGYAVNESEEYMPLTLSLSRKLVMELSDARKNGKLPFLRPDGKSQVTLEYEGGKPVRIDTVVLSAQHDPDIELADLRKSLMENIIIPALPENMLTDNTKYYINPTGRFVLGGPVADTGLTGRKIIADTYGGYAHHGGGAFSGKDATKVDRSAALALRNIAKTIVASGAADECEIQAAVRWIMDHYDLRPEGMIRQFSLRSPVYRQSASFGAFGRTDVTLPWEIIDACALEDLKALL